MGARDRPLNGYAQRGSFHVIGTRAAAIELFPVFAHAKRCGPGAGSSSVPDALARSCRDPIENLYLNCGWGTGVQGDAGSGWVFADLVAGRAGPLARPYALERFTTGALIDEQGRRWSPLMQARTVRGSRSAPGRGGAGDWETGRSASGTRSSWMFAEREREPGSSRRTTRQKA